MKSSKQTFAMMSACNPGQAPSGLIIRPLAGKPLFQWPLEAALGCGAIDMVCLVTDCPHVRASLAGLGDHPRLRIIEPFPALQADSAPVEQLMPAFAAQEECDTVVFVGATAPLLESSDLDHGLNLLASGDYESVLSGVRQRRVIWNVSRQGPATLAGYDSTHRPSPLDWDGFMVENGAFYAAGRQQLLQTRCHLSGRIGLVAMPSASALELDELHTWQLVETILRQRQPTEQLRRRMQDIQLFVSDVDGVLTDAGMYYSEQGDELKKFSTRDGMGLVLLRQAGLKTMLLTSENTEIVSRRARKLKIDIVDQGAGDKVERLCKVLDELGLDMHQVCYIGDDCNDTALLAEVGLACCPADAIDANRQLAHIVCTRPGGGGCVREVIDMLLAARSRTAD